ncbi:hypothetical protein GLYMA_05G094550v4 [Glycine max]|nr:hypothetical protein GLYMA_05G094550v4 [Glycine max]KAH1133589.1 hypothetical protein GYH30_012124 [Glycine max]
MLFIALLRPFLFLMKCLTIDIICLEGCNGTCRPLPID